MIKRELYMQRIDLSRNGIKHRNIRKFLTMSEWT